MSNPENSHRQFLRKSAILSYAVYTGLPVRATQKARDEKITVLNPFGRVPVSFIIDDSTALVNMAPQRHYVTENHQGINGLLARKSPGHREGTKMRQGHKVSRPPRVPGNKGGTKNPRCDQRSHGLLYF